MLYSRKHRLCWRNVPFSLWCNIWWKSSIFHYYKDLNALKFTCSFESIWSYSVWILNSLNTTKMCWSQLVEGKSTKVWMRHLKICLGHCIKSLLWAWSTGCSKLNNIRQKLFVHGVLKICLFLIWKKVEILI